MRTRGIFAREMPRFKTHSAFVAALAIDLEKTGVRSTEARKHLTDRPNAASRFREKKRGRNDNADQSTKLRQKKGRLDRPSSAAHILGLNPPRCTATALTRNKGENRVTRKEYSTRHGNYQASKPDAGANQR